MPIDEDDLQTFEILTERGRDFKCQEFPLTIPGWRL